MLKCPLCGGTLDALRNSVLQQVLGCQIAPVPTLAPSGATEIRDMATGSGWGTVVW